jgi:hypothetical protein
MSEAPDNANIARAPAPVAPLAVNALPEFVSRLQTHLNAWPTGIVPIDREDFQRLLNVAKVQIIAAAGPR